MSSCEEKKNQGFSISLEPNSLGTYLCIPWFSNDKLTKNQLTIFIDISGSMEGGPIQRVHQVVLKLLDDEEFIKNIDLKIIMFNETLSREFTLQEYIQRGLPICKSRTNFTTIFEYIYKFNLGSNHTFIIMTDGDDTCSDVNVLKQQINMTKDYLKKREEKNNYECIVHVLGTDDVKASTLEQMVQCGSSVGIIRYAKTEQDIEQKFDDLFNIIQNSFQMKLIIQRKNGTTTFKEAKCVDKKIECLISSSSSPLIHVLINNKIIPIVQLNQPRGIEMIR